MYNADKTGMVDYALESAGGSVISIRCSETYAFKTALISLFGIPLWYTSNSPRMVIQVSSNSFNTTSQTEPVRMQDFFKGDVLTLHACHDAATFFLPQNFVGGRGILVHHQPLWQASKQTQKQGSFSNPKVFFYPPNTPPPPQKKKKKKNQIQRGVLTPPPPCICACYQPSADWFQHCWKKCVDHRGDYIEK